MATIKMENVSVDIPIYDIVGSSLRRIILSKTIGGRFGQAGSFVVVSALKGINFHANDGDCIGLVGNNGSGKTTLLRVLAGIYPPTGGMVEIAGRVTPIFETTLGMNPDATGLENIRICGALWGLSRQQVDSSIEEIAAFTELGNYLSVPVRTYSVGMLLRLAFGIATVREPDILLLDEVIGAGDAAFFQKAFTRLMGMVSRARIVLVASHSDAIIRQLCNKVLWLSNGELVAYGDVEETLEAYRRQTLRDASQSVRAGIGDNNRGSLFVENAGLDAATANFSQAALDEIDRIGFQPFIIVVIRGPKCDKMVITCSTQNELHEFLASLSAASVFEMSRVLRAIERSLSGDSARAADLLTTWVRDGNPELSERCHISLPPNVFHPAIVGYPMFQVEEASQQDSIEMRAQSIVDLLVAYVRFPGNDALRFALIDALAVAASRIADSPEQIREIARAVELAVELNPQSVQLQAVRNGLVVADIIPTQVDLRADSGSS